MLGKKEKLEGKLRTREYVSPCGKLLLGVSEQRLCMCDWMVGERIEKTMARLRRYRDPVDKLDDIHVLDRAGRQLDEYFDGRRISFDLPLLPFGTSFQKAVWDTLSTIPFGTTLSYLDIARMLSRPESVRAVANAIGANPISIFIPCHRVIGSDGSITGYAGGKDAKRYLLGLESKTYKPNVGLSVLN